MRPLALFATLAACLSSGAALAAPAPPAGRYPCYSYTIAQVVQRQNKADVGRMETVLDEQALAQVQNVVPAGFSMVLDGNGNYRVQGTSTAGRYSFNPNTGRMTFTGGGASLNFQRYFVKDGIHILRFAPDPNVFYQCQMGSATGAANAGTGGEYRYPTAASLSTGPGRAANFTGRFEGYYVCSQGETALRLDLTASANGRVTAIFAFGGNSNVPSGSFTLTGEWSGDAMVLKPDRWIAQPPGYGMVGLSGNFNGYSNAIRGQVHLPSCSVFSVKRAR